MPRKQFYDIGKQAYLFPGQCQLDGERNNLEEPVGQWCAHELIRAYGICITDIEFERQVKVGSKSYRIDILVSRRGEPWAVVECKEPGYTKHEGGMAQAISYAAAQEIKAEFAVYTNGNAWNVQRCLHGQWVPVPDIPIPGGDEARKPMEYLLQTIHDVAPLLYILHEPIEGKTVKKFFEKMQRFFHGWNCLTSESGNKNLHFAVELLLRVLSAGKESEHYCHSKLEDARASLERFRDSAGFPFEIYPLEGAQSIFMKMRALNLAVSGMVKGTKDLSVYEGYLLRLSAALLEYGQNWASSKDPYPQVGANVHDALEDLLSYVLAVRLNVSLPDALDSGAVRDMKSYCGFAWDSTETEP
jgi:hypothetical protein